MSALAPEGQAARLLRQLVGRPLTTIAGRTNTILAVEPPNVLVATGRSPQGRPVPIAWVDEALDQLNITGRLEIHPRSSSHRSAFIGAVLQQLPGARVENSSPPVIYLEPLAAAAATAEGVDRDGIFAGLLDRYALAAGRGEQAELRQRLFGGRDEASCALCGEVYPVDLLGAVHIKPRAACTDDERRDLDNVVLAACLLGCDALYELGYLTVDATGHIMPADGPHAGAVAGRIGRLAGRRVDRHGAATAHYFAWHRDHRFKGVTNAIG
jgi:hypothetical protein